MHWRRIVLRSAMIAALTWLGACLIIGPVAVEGVLHPARRALSSADVAEARSVASSNEAALADAAIQAGDGAWLRAWTMRPHNANGNAVVLLHGQADNRTGMLGVAGMLLRRGYAILLPDARAHGDSGGSVATYGYLESGDIARWLAWLRQDEKPRCIYGIGDSMGAAELLSSLSAGAGFCAVVAESAFSSFRSAAYQRLGQAFHTGPWLGRTLLRPAVEFAFLYARVRYGADFAKDSPRNAVARTRVPVMLIHGKADDNLAPANSEEIREGNADVVLWEPEGAGHCGASATAPAEYEQRVTRWFEDNGPEPARVRIEP
jgi:uncharacterized protein